MRVLITTWAWASHLTPLVQFGWALRAEGHDVVVVSSADLAGDIRAAGLPAAVVGEQVEFGPQVGRYFEWLVSQPGPVRWTDIRHWGAGNVATYRMVAEKTVDALLDFAAGWRPDAIVYDPTTFAGPLVAASLGVLAVRHIWGIDYTHRTSEFEAEALTPLCDRLGIAPMDTLGDVTVDPCPASLQYPTCVATLPMRFVPYNGPAVHQRRWLEPPNRPRVCVLGSSAVARLSGGTVVPFAAPVIAGLADLDVEVIAVVPDSEASTISMVPDRVELIEPTPLHLLLPQCSLVIHQGGGGTLMTTLAAGVPQLLAPMFTDHVANAERLTETGAGDWLFARDLDARDVAERATALLDPVGARPSAVRLAREMAAAPSAAHVVGALEELVDSRAA